MSLTKRQPERVKALGLLCSVGYREGLPLLARAAFVPGVPMLAGPCGPTIAFTLPPCPGKSGATMLYLPESRSATRFHEWWSRPMGCSSRRFGPSPSHRAYRRPFSDSIRFGHGPATEVTVT